jgi:hypothetical protein
LFLSSEAGARSPSQAFGAYAQPLRRSIACFSERVQLRRGGVDHRVGADMLLPDSGDSIPLRDIHGTARIALSVRLHHRTVQVTVSPRRWEVRTAAYVYQFDDPDDPRREIAGFHWHPHVEGLPYPHVHALDAPASTQRLHLPTGFITLKDVLLFAVRDFDVRPIRADWQAALEAADASLRASLRWAAAPSSDGGRLEST